jgi:hypothetical protein
MMGLGLRLLMTNEATAAPAAFVTATTKFCHRMGNGRYRIEDDSLLSYPFPVFL